MLKLRISECLGKLTYKVPRECVCTSTLPVFVLKIRRAGTCEYIHHFQSDELDGDLVSFYVDGEIQALAEGYWQADLFAGCDWIAESVLIKERMTATALQKQDITTPCVTSCAPQTVPCCEPKVEHHAENCC